MRNLETFSDKTKQSYLEAYPTLDVTTCNIPKESDVFYELSGRLGLIEFHLNHRTHLYGLKYNGSLRVSQSFSYVEDVLKLSCPKCGSLSGSLTCFQGKWRCASCLVLPSLLEEQKRFVGKKILESSANGDTTSLESLLLSPSAKKKIRGLLGLSMLGISDNICTLPLDYKHHWEIRRIY